MPNTRLPYRITVTAPAPTAADIEQQSPLWPLQSQLRGIVTQAIQSGAVAPEDVAQIWDVNNDVESLFATWQRLPITTLRAIIRAKISPPGLDLSGKPVLSGFQQALLNASHWSDVLPS